jgi:lipoprotein-anchoring transpeptidase ErfK/SrfK
MKTICLFIALLLPLSLQAKGVHVIISLRQETAWLVDNGTGKVICESPVGTGRKGFRTPTGLYHVGSKHWIHVSTIYHVHMDHYLQLEGNEFGLHYDPFRVSADGYFGTPASHGCIRLPYAQSVIFYNTCAIGTPVRILAN